MKFLAARPFWPPIQPSRAPHMGWEWRVFFRASDVDGAFEFVHPGRTDVYQPVSDEVVEAGLSLALRGCGEPLRRLLGFLFCFHLRSSCCPSKTSSQETMPLPSVSTVATTQLAGTVSPRTTRSRLAATAGWAVLVSAG